MNQPIDSNALLAMLQWQVEGGVCDAIGDSPVNRYELEAKAPKPKAAAAPPPLALAVEADPIADAEQMAGACDSLAALADAMQAYPHCDLQKGARNFVFSDGMAGAPVMIIGEAPGRDEDMDGRPFVGRAGQLLDRMLAAIDLSRQAHDAESAVYITNVLPWRPPGNRTPEAREIAMMLPFVQRHIALAAPKYVVLMGNTPCQALLGRAGITRIRGQWTEAVGLPTLPMFHPAYLLRQPAAKREAWADLLELRARLNA